MNTYLIFLFITILVLGYLLKIIEGNVLDSPFRILENDIWNVIITMTTGTFIMQWGMVTYMLLQMVEE